jgi:hypothetical protein
LAEPANEASQDCKRAGTDDSPRGIGGEVEDIRRALGNEGLVKLVGRAVQRREEGREENPSNRHSTRSPARQRSDESCAEPGVRDAVCGLVRNVSWQRTRV